MDSAAESRGIEEQVKVAACPRFEPHASGEGGQPSTVLAVAEGHPGALDPAAANAWPEIDEEQCQFASRLLKRVPSETPTVPLEGATRIFSYSG